ncbi:MAG: tetratricopeptide repeat protein [Bryobacterales bacterium]|nr:tetratricopeptide repeat protein [Bryobacterales bacterium]
MSYEPHSVAEVSNLLLLWAKRPGPGMALVEFVSEYARQAVFQQVSVGMGQPIPELVFESTGDLEPDVRGLVSRLRAEKSPLVSVRGIADAFPGPELRRRVLGLLNFLRESISEYSGKQVWWVTPEVGNLLTECAPDWHSWFHPRLMLLEETVVSAPEVPQVKPATLPKPQADAIVTDARTRLAASAHNANSAERWRQLADPAIVALQQAGSPTAATALREEFLDTIYGEAQDATRQSRVRADIHALLQHGYFAAAATLIGQGSEVAAPGSSLNRCREAKFLGAVAKGRSGRPAEAEQELRELVAELQSDVVDGTLEPERQLASVLSNWGNTLALLGEPSQAALAYSSAIATLEGAMQHGMPGLEAFLATSLMNRGNAYVALHRLSEAQDSLDRAIAIFQRRVDEGHHEADTDLAKALINRGNVLAFCDQPEAALRDYGKVIECLARLPIESGTNAVALLASALMNRGNVLSTLGRHGEAGEMLDRSIAIRSTMVQSGRREVLPDLGIALVNRGLVAQSQAQHDVACSHLRAARAAFESARTYGHQGLGQAIAAVDELLNVGHCLDPQ